MSRLIDADALIVELEKDENRFDREAEDGERNPQTCTDGYAKAMWSRANGIRDAIISIYDAPTIDAVEVVRCKKCRHWSNGDDIRGICYRCPNTRQMRYDDFCSYGERRTK